MLVTSCCGEAFSCGRVQALAFEFGSNGALKASVKSSLIELSGWSGLNVKGVSALRGVRTFRGKNLQRP
jgi:hypothetical protein